MVVVPGSDRNVVGCGEAARLWRLRLGTALRRTGLSDPRTPPPTDAARQHGEPPHAAVLSFYRYQADTGADAAPFLWKQTHVRSGRYLTFLEHVAERAPQKRTAIRIYAARKTFPVLTPTAIDALQDAEASYDPTLKE
ncbi:hypothetical protein ACFVX3_18410 [Rhodococcus erythropolis]